MTRKIGVVTVARSDYGIYLPVLREIQKETSLRLQLIAAGMHLSPEFGSTFREIEADGLEIAEKVEMLLSSDRPEGIAKSIGLGVVGFAQAFSRLQPDLLVVLGDRFEMYAAAVAALPFKIPVAHIHGGEVTEGAIDDALRHSLTKLSHLHFAATEEYGRRIIQLGEEPWRVAVSGAPGLDHLKSLRLLTREELFQKHQLLLDRPPLLVTFHPVTLEFEETESQVQALLKALDQVDQADTPAVFTLSNADTGSRTVIQAIDRYVQAHPSSRMVKNLGTQGYFSLMAVAAAMVGNSSSGIIEAASFGLPVVNIGNRQKGRLRARNVIDVGNESQAILEGILKATDPAFRKSLEGMTNPYGDGQAAQRIVRRLKDAPLDQKLLLKHFHSVPHSFLPT